MFIQTIDDKEIERIVNKPFINELISPEEAVLLLNIPNEKICLLTHAADRLRELLVGDVVTYVINRNINFTSYCIKGCRFCYFSATLKAPETGYIRTDDEIRDRVREGAELGVTEYCIQGGIHPESSLEWYSNILRIVKDEHKLVSGKNVHIHAFSPEEIKRAMYTSKFSAEEVLKKLKEEGLDTMPGTAAEILNDQIRKEISPGRINVDEWKHIISTAHKLGIATTSTMMYGHIETPELVIEHMNVLRKIQLKNKKLGIRGITEFVPLRFVNEWNKIPISLKNLDPLLPMEESDYRNQQEWDIKIHAVARLFFGSIIPNIQASYTKMGTRLTQQVLQAGANDLGGTLMEENITNAARQEKKEVLNIKSLTSIATDVGRPVKERNTIYDFM
ncbi:MAG: 5-amino-6-(D-ribitylamino)uracil--L-tyrosine 4-hydroxyphenyl transferase CofH [Candidatus Hodarchaeales archaeon]|jgi:FO synthase subunit 2